jgi:hypothetical protein
MLVRADAIAARMPWTTKHLYDHHLPVWFPGLAKDKCSGGGLATLITLSASTPTYVLKIDDLIRSCSVSPATPKPKFDGARVLARALEPLF